MADIRLDPSELQPMVQSIVAEVLRELEKHRQVHDGRLAYSEAEAADLLGLNQWQLRDLRLAGKIAHARIVGNRIRYTLDDLKAYLRQGRQPGTE